MPRKALGREIRRLRRSSSFTLRELASRVRSSATHLCDIEQGRRTPSDSLLRRIAVKTGAEYEGLRLLKPVVEKDLEDWYARDIEVRRLMREVKDSGVSIEKVLARLRAAGGETAEPDKPGR